MVNIEKTEVQHVEPERVNIEIKIGSQTLKQVQDFVYLGGTVSEEAATERDIKRRIGLKCGVMQNLNPIWVNNIIEEIQMWCFDFLFFFIFLFFIVRLVFCE